MKPYVVRGLVNKKGEIIKANSPTVVRESSRRDGKTITAILTDVVERRMAREKKRES